MTWEPLNYCCNINVKDLWQGEVLGTYSYTSLRYPFTVLLYQIVTEI